MTWAPQTGHWKTLTYRRMSVKLSSVSCSRTHQSCFPSRSYYYPTVLSCTIATPRFELLLPHCTIMYNSSTQLLTTIAALYYHLQQQIVAISYYCRTALSVTPRYQLLFPHFTIMYNCSTQILATIAALYYHVQQQHLANS